MNRLSYILVFVILPLFPLRAETLYTVYREYMLLGEMTCSPWYTELKLDRQKRLFELDSFDAGSNTYVWKTYTMADYKKSGSTETFTGYATAHGHVDKYNAIHVTIRPDEEGRLTLKLQGGIQTSYIIYTLGTKEEFEQGNGVDDNGHKWVDLGLSVMWSPIGMGATEEGGISKELYAYGYTTPISGGKQPDYTDPGVEDISGNPRFDAATAHWGAPWRMPTIDEAQELSANCVHTGYIKKVGGSENGRWTGYWKLTSKKNGRSVFIPMGVQPSGWSDFRVSGKITAPGNILNKRERLTATHTAVQIMAGMGGYKEVGCMLIPVRGEKSYRFTPSRAGRGNSPGSKEQLSPSIPLTPPSPRREGLAWYLSLSHPSKLTDKRLADERQAIEDYLASRPDAYEFVSVRRELLDRELKERTENPNARQANGTTGGQSAGVRKAPVQKKTSTQQTKKKPAQQTKKTQLQSVIRKKLGL